MIPILYDFGTTDFTNNGMGRLRDCVACTVTEERNGIYECDFEYPTDGQLYAEIVPGRTIGVTHDDNGDVQYFDIVSFSKPLLGVVTFHAVHVSYRQRELVATGSNVQSLAEAFTLLESAVPANPFTYITDKTTTGYLACADGTPRSVRQILGGVEGSILDAYGGEYTWDNFTVILSNGRGRLRDFTVRYGANLIDYQNETDYQPSYTSCIPFWQGSNDAGDEVVVTGHKVDTGRVSFTGRDICVPLDLTDKFQDKPTVAGLDEMAVQYMETNAVYDANRSIELQFARIQDADEDWPEGFQNLLQCGLCDTITVVTPDGTGQYKIVRVVWDVLREEYAEMTLGNLSTTLAEALGITSGSEGVPTVETKLVQIAPGPEFDLYNSNDPIVVKKQNGVCQLTGAVKPKATIAGGTTSHTLCTIPEGFRPITGGTIRMLCQGTATDMWLLSIAPDTGEVYMNRYRGTESAYNAFKAVSPSGWLPFNVTWIIGGAL